MRIATPSMPGSKCIDCTWNPCPSYLRDRAIRGVPDTRVSLSYSKGVQRPPQYRVKKVDNCGIKYTIPSATPSSANPTCFHGTSLLCYECRYYLIVFAENTPSMTLVQLMPVKLWVSTF